ncbi:MULTISPECIES: hypothetical protein [Xanthobacter]|uniref:hypothetical protein n=1 Tax=Xanthobacter TaxID=279 RepID=UPI001AEB6432|nr:hypothetical protein [Xanthobacter flavus]MBP2149067.1 hypothetical protein [Xanthobacter flavus]
MPSAARIQSGRYTEADVLALYLKYRESRIGPFTREVGDFIAHSKRNRGATLDSTAYIFSQIAFFHTYQSNQKRPLDPKGPCGWWLRHYLLTKIKEESEHDLLRSIGLTKKQSKNAVKSWFPTDESYQNIINCNDPDILYGMAGLFSQKIVVNSAFELNAVKREVFDIFQREKIEATEIDRFIVATAVILNGKSVDIVSGFTARIQLTIGHHRSEPMERSSEFESDLGYTISSILPDGNLKIAIVTQNNTGDRIVDVGFDLLDTKIDTEPYFSRSLIRIGDHGIPKLDLDRKICFNSEKYPHVFEI